MTQTVEIIVSEPTRSELVAAAGWPRSVRFVSSPSGRSSPVARLMVARLDGLADEDRLGRLLALARGRVVRPVVFLASGSGKSHLSLAVLQAMVLLSKRATPSTKADPYVAPDDASFRRLVLARVQGAEKELIASASIGDGVLSVWSCEPRLYRCPVKDIPPLRNLSAEGLHGFEVSESGSRIHWAEGDVDINMETIRERTDPECRRRNEAKHRQDAGRYGKAIRVLREQKGIAQKDIPGLSDRQVRRLEEGRTVPHIETLKKLAAAHEMSIDDYLKELATLSRTGGNRRRKAA
jgi:hypothetical protein